MITQIRYLADTAQHHKTVEIGIVIIVIVSCYWFVFLTSLDQLSALFEILQRKKTVIKKRAPEKLFGRVFSGLRGDDTKICLKNMGI